MAERRVPSSATAATRGDRPHRPPRRLDPAVLDVWPLGGAGALVREGDCEAAGRQSHGGADAPCGGAVRSEEEVAF